MAITSIYYSTRADAAFGRSLDGGTTWENVPGFTTSGDNFGNKVAISPYIDKYVELLRTGVNTFYTNNRYVTNGASNLTSEIESSPEVQILDKYTSYIADISGFRRSTNSFTSYTFRVDFNTGSWTAPNSVRFWMSCPEKGVMALNIDNDPYLYKTNSGGQGWSVLAAGNPLDTDAMDVGGIWCDLNVDVIVVATLDKIWRSGDGGNTFNSVLSFAQISQVNVKTQLVQGSQNCLYIIDNNLIVYKSSDAGQSWTPIAALPGSPGSIMSLSFDKDDNGFVSVESSIYRVYQDSTNPLGYSYELSTTTVAAVLKLAIVTYDCNCPAGFVYNESLNECTKLDSTGKIGNLYTDFVNCPYSLTDCTDSENILYADGDTSSGLDAFINKIISYDGGCYRVEPHNTLEYDMVTIDASESTVYEDCFSCNPIYRLYPCGDTDFAYCTDTDLSAYAGTTNAITITIDDLPIEGCFIVGSDTDYQCESLSNVEVVDVLTDCSLCTAPIFKLTVCINPETVIYVQDAAFQAVVNKSVILEGYPDLCWSVESVEVAETEPISASYNHVYTDCACCKQYTCNP